MTLSNIVSPYSCHKLERFHQGDILRDIELVEWAYKEEEEGGKKIALRKRNLEYVIIITQECDLEQDVKNRNDPEMANHDKFMQSILLIPAYPAEKVKRGIHLEEVRMQQFGSRQWKLLQENRDYRYHYLVDHPEYQVPELVADFKHYFTIPRDIIYAEYQNPEHYLASLSELFRENLSIRFAQYLARIGLPEFTTPVQSAEY